MKKSTIVSQTKKKPAKQTKTMANYSTEIFKKEIEYFVELD